MTVYFDPTNKAWLDDAVHSTIPDDAVKLTLPQKKALQAEQHRLGSDYEIGTDAGGNAVVIERPFDVAAAIALKRRQIEKHYTLAMSIITARYPQTEIDGFTAQINEVRAYRDEEQRQTPDIDHFPLLKNLAEQSGHTVENRVARIEQKYGEYATVYGALTGKRQALSDAIDAIDPALATREDLSAIDPTELEVLSKQLQGGQIRRFR